MRTNYYLRYDICEKCNRYEELHIGKSSAGWKFLFHSIKKEDLTTDLVTYDQWVDFLKITTENEGAKIFNEYGEEILLENFIKIVEMKQGEKEKDPSKWNLYYVDVRGYNFGSGNFS